MLLSCGMRSLLLFFFTLVCAVLFAPTSYSQVEILPPARPEPGMQAELERTYQMWRSAMLNSNLQQWERSVATYRKVYTRNRIVSEKQPFPSALFESPIQPPSLAGLRPLGVYTRRDTASAVYFGKADFGVAAPGEIKDVFLVLRFLKENSGWRFDNNRIVKIGPQSDVLHQIRMQDLSFLKDPEFQPLESVPQIPQAVTAPELMAEAWVTAIGYEAEIYINGVSQGKISDRSGRELVMGGVRRGINQISIKTRRLTDVKVEPRFGVAIYAAKGPGEKANRVFQLAPVAKVDERIEMRFNGVVLN